MWDSILFISVSRSCTLGTAGIGKTLILFSVSFFASTKAICEMTVLARIFLSQGVNFPVFIWRKAREVPLVQSHIF